MPSSMPPLNLLHHAPADAVSRLLNRAEPLPATADVIIVGGGIMGCSAAWYLARANLKVVLLEKNRIASQQSGRNWGFVRSLYRDPAELPLAAQALSLWPGLRAELGHETGWMRSGCLFLCADESERRSYQAWLAEAGGRVSDTRMLSPDEIAARFPMVSRRTGGGIIAESDGQAEPTLATLAFARAAIGAGAVVLEDCGVSALDVAGGSVCGVQTEHGSVRAPIVICAAGAQTFRLLQALDVKLPQKVVRSTVSLTAPLPAMGLPCFVGYGLGLRQRPDGSCIIATDAGTDIDLTLDSLRASHYFLREVVRNHKGFSFRLGKPFVNDLYTRLSVPKSDWAIKPRDPDIAPNTHRVRDNRKRFAELFARMPPVEIFKSWAGNIDVMPDALPVIDAAWPARGLIIATGFSGHGFGLGPAVGSTLAALARGAEPKTDLAPFSADRFLRGAYSRPYAAI